MMASCTTDMMTSFWVISYNSRGCTNLFKRRYLSDILSLCDFLFIQEHWLTDGQLDSLNEVSDVHYATAVSGFGDSEVLEGRPYSGCAIFWPHNLAAHADIIKTDSNRVCVLNVHDNSSNLLLLCICCHCGDPGAASRLEATVRKTQPHLASCSGGRPWPTEHWPCICLEEGSYSWRLAHCGHSNAPAEYAIKEEEEYAI